MPITNTLPEITPEPIDTLRAKLIEKLKIDGVNKVKQLNDSHIVFYPEKMLHELDKIVRDGEEEFIKKIGRRMTIKEKQTIYR